MTKTCSYCRYSNSADEHRCRRCGRPLADMYALAGRGNLAHAPQPEPEVVAVAAAPAAGGAPRQGRLFPDRPAGKIIPFEALSEPEWEPPAPPPKPKTSSPRRASPRRTAVDCEIQPSLELPPDPTAGHLLDTTVEAVIYCDAPVATPTHRALAAAVDLSMILIGFCLFLVTFHLLGGVFVSNRLMLMTWAVSAVLIGLFYGFLWVCGGGLTPGMRATRLTLMNFDGFPPDSADRWLRYLGACLSYGAFGLGILWSLLDEENLSWQDHISKTFPTFCGPESNFVKRR
jgi:uncharacterized RDD family membrane protein YckC